MDVVSTVFGLCPIGQVPVVSGVAAHLIGVATSRQVAGGAPGHVLFVGVLASPRVPVPAASLMFSSLPFEHSPRLPELEWRGELR